MMLTKFIEDASWMVTKLMKKSSRLGWALNKPEMILKST